MEPAAATAVVLIGCVGGAPFLPKLAMLAKSNLALAVGAMVLLMVVTIGYAPIVVPLAVEGATVDPLAIAQSLVLFMLIPLGLGLLRARPLPGARRRLGRPGRPRVHAWGCSSGSGAPSC